MDEHLQYLKDTPHVVGLRQVSREIAKDSISKVFLAQDADADLRARVLKMCVDRNVDVVSVASMLVLGTACDIERPAAVAALLKQDFIN